MRRARTLILLILIVIICLVVGVVSVNQFMLAPQPVEPTYVDIYYASQNIAPGAEITEEVLGTMRIPQENVVAVMYTREELPFLLGKVAKYPIAQGSPLTEALVTDRSAAVPISGPQWAALIPPGMTAISIPANRLSLSAYAVNDGAHVNVNVCLLFVDVDPAFQTILPNVTGTLTGTGITPDSLPVLSLGVIPSEAPEGRLVLDPSVQQPFLLLPSEPQRPRLACQMILQDIVVMKVGNFPLIPTTAAQTVPPPPVEEQPAAPPDIVTLIVTPQDSITLTYLMYTGAEIQLALRNPTDQSRQITEAATLQFLLSQYSFPIPAKLPYAIHPALSELVSPTLPNDTVNVPPQ